jgi:YggT family protein
VTIRNLIIDFLQIYSLVIIIRAVLSWVQVERRNQLARIICNVTDPVLVPIQRIVPPIGGTLDISPIIALVLIQLLKTIVIRTF